jgi:large subunit ribosomal protein L1
MSSHGKKYRKSSTLLDRTKKYTLSEALDLLSSFEKAKYDETVQIGMKLTIDPKQSDQTVRGAINLPNGVGKEKRVVVFAEGEKAEVAKKAGAFMVGSDDLIEKISGGWMDFDVAIGSPDVMKKVGKIARLLGPQGKMPSPKTGTVSNDLETVVKEFKAGKVEYKNDSDGNLHEREGRLHTEHNDLVLDESGDIPGRPRRQ